MGLRCLLFCSDPATAEPISQVLSGLGVEEESCTEAVIAVERVTSQAFRIVIIDWDQQPEAGFLLKTARERKASERPLTLAIVSDDASVPKALQAGANSILRKPILINQVKDTLTTARDLLRAKENTAQAAAAGVSTGSATVVSLPRPSSEATPAENPLRGGEFLSAAAAAPGAHFDTESEMQKSLEQSAVGEVDPLEELEPMAAPVAREPSPPPTEALRPMEDQPRGLEYLLRARGVSRAPVAPVAPVQLPTPPPAPAKPELLGFEASPSAPSEADAASNPSEAGARAAHAQEHEQKTEAKLFAYIEDGGEPEEPKKASGPGFRLGKGPITFALLLAACAVVAAPQAPWHGQVKILFGRGQKVLHGWLNPQLVTPAQAPASHESFARAGDEYKLPVAETIPDATTDPSQIQVKPMVDPTKKPGTDPAAQGDGNATTSADPSQPQGQAQPGQVQPQQVQPQGQAAGTQENPTPAQTAPATGPNPPVVEPQPAPSTTSSTPPPAEQPSVSAVAIPPQQQVATQPEPKSAPVHVAPAPSNPPAQTQAIPSSLKSQMASMTPDAGGNKPPEAAMQAIEPVDVPELTERALLTDQTAIEYPINAKGQSGTVILQVFIGRDGSVQDAKFLQGSLAFARVAIDGVKQWKFKPYQMNGRAVSVQTKLTMTFKPGQPGNP